MSFCGHFASWWWFLFCVSEVVVNLCLSVVVLRRSFCLSGCFVSVCGRHLVCLGFCPFGHLGGHYVSLWLFFSLCVVILHLFASSRSPFCISLWLSACIFLVVIVCVFVVVFCLSLWSSYCVLVVVVLCPFASLSGFVSFRTLF